MRLEQAVELTSDRARIDVSWKPFEIHPEVPPEGMPLSALSYTSGELSAMIDNLKRHAAGEGLDFSGIGIERGIVNTHRALLAGCYAQQEEPAHFSKFHHALFHAHFTEGRNINDDSVLENLAQSSGLDAARMIKALDTGAFEEALQETAAKAAGTSITAVPTFHLDGRYLIVGAQPVEAIAKVIDRILSEKDTSPEV